MHGPTVSTATSPEQKQTYHHRKIQSVAENASFTHHSTQRQKIHGIHQHIEHQGERRTRTTCTSIDERIQKYLQNETQTHWSPHPIINFACLRCSPPRWIWERQPSTTKLVLPGEKPEYPTAETLSQNHTSQRQREKRQNEAKWKRVGKGEYL